MSAVDPKGSEKYFIEGETFEGIRNQPTQTGTEKYSVNAFSEENLFPPNNADTGKFFLVFE